MSPSQSVELRDRRAQKARRSFTTLAAFVLGVPLAVGLLALVYIGPWRDTELYRYVSHPVEVVEVLLFGVAVAALLTKAATALVERAAFRKAVLPAWDRKPVPPTEAGRLLEGVGRLGAAWQNTWLVRRVAGVLDFVKNRGTADGLDDQARALADNDAAALDGSYGLTRFISWAIPILGFLGTVLGITEAVAGVTPEKLEKSLSTVTDGLALAFDTTAVALALTMVVMFLSFLTERLEEGVLQGVDGYVEEHLAHRFDRGTSESAGIADAVRGHTDALLKATEELVYRQAELWNRTVMEAQGQWLETGVRQQEAVVAALEKVLDRTTEGHAVRLLALEKHAAAQGSGLLDRIADLTDTVYQGARDQHAALTEIARHLAVQVDALARLDAGNAQVVRLQETLDRNLSVLAGTGAFEEAVASLTAAIHLLTARVAPAPAAPARGAQRPGTAA